MTDADTLLARLNAEGFSVRTEKNKLLIQPISKLKGDLRDDVITHRRGLIDLLRARVRQGAIDRAVDAVAPPDFDSMGSVVLEEYVLIQTREDDDDPEFLAVSPAWLEELRQFAAVRKREVQEKADRVGKSKKRRGKSPR